MHFSHTSSVALPGIFGVLWQGRKVGPSLGVGPDPVKVDVAVGRRGLVLVDGDVFPGPSGEVSPERTRLVLSIHGSCYNAQH